MNRVIALNSGGFDSVVMLHHLKESEEEVISLFFDYGQVNLELERTCAREVAKKLGLEHKEITLPKIDWSNSSLYTNADNSHKAQYLEMRNVIFMSYGLSFAESRGAKAIAMAILKDGQYPDTNSKFIENTTKWLKECFNIEFMTPFATVDKETLGYLARMYKIKRDMFFSCNTPIDNKPCGTCGDCEALDYICSTQLDNTIPIHAWFDNDLKYSQEFEDLYMKMPITEMRLLTNNSCQFTCEHCFYGFEKSEVLPKEDFLSIIDQAHEYGIENIHFSGKEPLVNEDVFTYMNYIRDNYPNMTYDLVTNGFTIPKYIDKLVESKIHRVCLSVDSLENLTLRNFNTVDNVELLLDRGINTTIFIDLHKDNYYNVKGIVQYLYNLGVKDFFIRTIAKVGKGKNLDNTISVEDLNFVLAQLLDLEDLDCTMTLNWKTPYTVEILKRRDLVLGECLDTLMRTCDPRVSDNLCIDPEFYCGRYESQITVAQDGQVVGCALEMAVEKYSTISAGDIMKTSLNDIITRGKKLALELIKKRYEGEDKMPSCYHSYYTIK